MSLANKSQRKSPPLIRAQAINLSHGGGGKDMHDLILNVFVEAFDNAELDLLEDQARIEMAELVALGNRLAITTDSYVVYPIFFPGGDIGSLAVNGTVNDLAVGGAKPLYLTCGMIIEEGFPVVDLRRVVSSMKQAADACGVKVIAGDTKVVGRNAADKLFINTTGVGVIPANVNISVRNAQPGDIVLTNGTIGDHGAAILGARNDLALENSIESDCQSLSDLISRMLGVCPNIHCLRDATRGGIAGVLTEIAVASEVGVCLTESAIPVKEDVRALCEILGLDPLYFANEGKLIAVVPRADADAVLAEMRGHRCGRDAAIIGEVLAAPKSVVILQTAFGGQRMVDMLIGEQLPRIC